MLRARDTVAAAPLRVYTWREGFSLVALLFRTAMLIAHLEIGVAIGVYAVRVWRLNQNWLCVKPIIPTRARWRRAVVIGRAIQLS
jgi:hypothetical protein